MNPGLHCAKTLNKCLDASFLIYSCLYCSDFPTNPKLPISIFTYIHIHAHQHTDHRPLHCSQSEASIIINLPKTLLSDVFNIYTREAGPGILSLALEGPSKSEIKLEDRPNGFLGASYKVTRPGELLTKICFKIVVL